MSFLEKCKELFGKDDLYSIFGLTKDASEKQIKKGYHHVSLKVHPDRVSASQKERATEQFQALGRAYSVLSDRDRRAVYDETGCVDDDDPVEQERDWADYWRLLFKPLTIQDIEKFEKEYVGSAEEVEDVRAAYLACDGDMGGLLDRVPCASVDSEDRLRQLVQGLIDSGELPALPAFTNETKAKRAARKRRAMAEAAEAEEEKKKLGLGDGDGSLQAMIMARQEARGAAMGSFFDQLEAKYAKPEKKTKARKQKSK
ncbi:DnaJ subfamily C member 9 [Amphibalanus amphitrite]|uniref:DnaJ subfamily C member 9 n=1 Tax=Amphibalanus amphitrite TaxID=1232801 RepID=A0A6A4WAZ4_AMPAM|nr:DnaJ subfamily C member 9 [Amphibalanus amphitrite]